MEDFMSREQPGITLDKQPILFTLRDVILITGAVISVAVSWGIMSSRITNLEEAKNQNEKLMESLQQQIHVMELKDTELRTQIAGLLEQNRFRSNKPQY